MGWFRVLREADSRGFGDGKGILWKQPAFMVFLFWALNIIQGYRLLTWFCFPSNIGPHPLFLKIEMLFSENKSVFSGNLAAPDKPCSCSFYHSRNQVGIFCRHFLVLGIKHLPLSPQDGETMQHTGYEGWRETSVCVVFSATQGCTASLPIGSRPAFSCVV